MICLGIPYLFRFSKGCLPHILLGPFLKTLTHIRFCNGILDISSRPERWLKTENVTMLAFAWINWDLKCVKKCCECQQERYYRNTWNLKLLKIYQQNMHYVVPVSCEFCDTFKGALFIEQFRWLLLTMGTVFPWANTYSNSGYNRNRVSTTDVF